MAAGAAMPSMEPLLMSEKERKRLVLMMGVKKGADVNGATVTIRFFYLIEYRLSPTERNVGDDVRSL